MTDKQTWKDTKREYLLMLIKEGDLSNSNLHDAIAGVQHMIRRNYNPMPMPSTIDDMRRIVETLKGVKRDCPTCRWECNEGNDHPRWGEQWLRDEFEKDGACPIWEEHNANPKYALIPDGMAHEVAVNYLAHGPEALEVLKKHCSSCEMGFEMSDQVAPCNEPEGTCANKNIVIKMEGK